MPSLNMFHLLIIVFFWHHQMEDFTYSFQKPLQAPPQRRPLRPLPLLLRGAAAERVDGPHLRGGVHGADAAPSAAADRPLDVGLGRGRRRHYCRCGPLTVSLGHSKVAFLVFHSGL